MGESSTQNETAIDLHWINQDEIWEKTQNLYRSKAQNPMMDDAKRKTLDQLAEDAKEQQEQVMKQVNNQKNKIFKRPHELSKYKAKLLEISSSRKFHLFLNILKWLIILAVISAIITLIIIYRSSFDKFSVKDLFNYQNNTNTTTISAEYSSTFVTDQSVTDNSSSEERMATLSYTATITVTTQSSIMDNLVKHKEFFSSSIWPILFVLCSIVLIYLLIRKCILCMCRKPQPPPSSPTPNPIGQNLIARSEKIVLLDSLEQYPQFRTLFEEHLLIYTSIHNCLHDLTSNHDDNYILFLSHATFEVHSFQLNRLLNVTLGIFYEDNGQLQSGRFDTNSRIRFVFPKEYLRPHIRHTIILKSMKEGYEYRYLGLDDRADQCFDTACEQCRLLAIDLGQIPIGEPPSELLPRNDLL